MRLGGQLVPDRIISQLSFTGYYDGNGYTIRDLKMLDKNAVGASLFGFVNQAIISNLTIEKATITGYGALSAIVGAVTTKGGSINKTFIKGCIVKNPPSKAVAMA